MYIFSVIVVNIILCQQNTCADSFSVEAVDCLQTVKHGKHKYVRPGIVKQIVLSKVM